MTFRKIVFILFAGAMLFVEPGLSGMYIGIAIYAVLCFGFYALYGGFSDPGSNNLITRKHFAELTLGYATVVSAASLIIMGSKFAFSLTSCLSFWAVAVAAVWMACEKLPLRHHPGCQDGNGIVDNVDVSAVYQESHNCGYAKCPHYDYHHPMCPYYRKHFSQ